MPHKEISRDAKLLDAFLKLSHELNLTMSEDRIMKLFSDVFEDLLPGKLCSIRLIQEKGKDLKLVYANGKLIEKERSHFNITQASLKDLKLDENNIKNIFGRAGIIRVNEYQKVFINSVDGFGVALCDRKNFYGMANFEYTNADDVDIESDRRVALPLVHQMTAALRNTRLISEVVVIKDYLEKLLDNTNAPVIVVDRSGRITVVNQAMEIKTGYKRSTLLGSKFMKLIPEDDRARLLPLVISALRGESAVNVEIRIPKADMSSIAHIAFNSAPILSSFGELESVIFVGQDLTEVRALQKQVIHTEKLATLGQVAAGVAHELNNPLTSITVYSSYLIKKLDTDIEKSDLAKLKRVLSAAERIQTFTKDLVTYARPSSEDPILINIDTLIERSVSFCEHLINKHEASISLNFDEKINPVYGIYGQLEQVFVNLITNSCHALPSKGGTISITAKPSGNDQLKIEFSDTGSGIADKHLKHIFEPFFTTKDQGDGTGLGLSIVKNILKNHDAKIVAQSDLGKGTTFTITMYTK